MGSTKTTSSVGNKTVKLRRHKQNLSAFTLLELLVVIAIMGILAAVAVPALKNISKGHATASASRQMLDDIARARQLALAHRTTVYMVFVPPNFWNDAYFNNGIPFSNLSATNQAQAQTLLDRQAAAYTFISLRSVGDQPGRNTTQYLSPWRTLPEGTFIAADKFLQPNQSFNIPDPVNNSSFQIYSFQVTNIFRFPSEDAPLTSATALKLPYIAFNYLGQLESGRDEYIPLARGDVSFARDGNKVPQFSGTSTATESPPGNSTNAYTIVHIDWVTGRARIEQQQVQ